jgi:hypothetical protein
MVFSVKLSKKPNLHWNCYPCHLEENQFLDVDPVPGIPSLSRENQRFISSLHYCQSRQMLHHTWTGDVICKKFCPIGGWQLSMEHWYNERWSRKTSSGATISISNFTQISLGLNLSSHRSRVITTYKMWATVKIAFECFLSTENNRRKVTVHPFLALCHLISQ